MQRSLTLKLDEVTIRKAKVMAAKRDTSVSQLIAEGIGRLVDEDEAYEQARAEAMADLEPGYVKATREIPKPRSAPRVRAVIDRYATWRVHLVDPFR